MQDLFDTVWGDRREIVYEHAVELTLSVRRSKRALCCYVLNASAADCAVRDRRRGLRPAHLVAGHGRAPARAPDDVQGASAPPLPPHAELNRAHGVPQNALHTVSTHVFHRLIIPDWLLNWGPCQRVRDVKVSFDELEVRRRAHGSRPCADAFVGDASRSICGR